MKECFNCKKELERALLYNVEIDYCPECQGLWLDKDELRLAKDKKDESLRWLDVDLWQDEGKFRISRGGRLCPIDRLPLYEVEYGDSGIKVDVCNICQGIWLDKGEFRQIMKYLRNRADWEIIHNYYSNLAREALDVFVGPESIREEVEDFLTILRLLNFKFLSQSLVIDQIILGLSK